MHSKPSGGWDMRGIPEELGCGAVPWHSPGSGMVRVYPMGCWSCLGRTSCDCRFSQAA